jgi:hypothetical protein
MILLVVSVRTVNDQPPNSTPPDPTADDPTAFQRPTWDSPAPEPPSAPPLAPPAASAEPSAVQPSVTNPGTTDWPAEAGPAWSSAEPTPTPGNPQPPHPPTPYGAQPDQPQGTQPPPPYGAAAGDPYGAQPGVPYGAQAGAPYDAQAGSPYGAPQPGAYPGFPPPGAPAYPAPGSGGTSGFAIASLIFGILGGLLFSVVFGIVALVQIRKRGQTGRGLAIAGLALSGCWVLLIAAGVTAAIISDSGDGGRTGGATGNGTVSVATLGPGDCINGIQGTAAIEDLPVVPCALPHEGEVYAVFELPAGPWPGDTAVQSQSEKRCKAAFESYAPNAPDTVEVLFLHPLQQSWTRDRGVTCVATDERGTSTGSVRD